MKTIAETFGVARSNLIERMAGGRPRRGPQIRAGDAELASDIRRLVDQRPTYGYRRIAALSQTLPDRLMLQTMPLSAISRWNWSLVYCCLDRSGANSLGLPRRQTAISSASATN